jgi:predicted RNA-binding protein with PIN domain
VHWIIDGMNVLGSRPDGWWRDRAAARRRLVIALGRYRSESGDDVTVVFDGSNAADEVAEGQVSGVAVVFAPGGPDAADRVIAAMARSLVDARPTTVVSSDAELVRQARASGVEVAGASAFRRRLDG